MSASAKAKAAAATEQPDATALTEPPELPPSLDKQRYEIDAAKQAYLKEAESEAPNRLRERELSNRVIALQRRFTETIVAGAKPCMGCGVTPHGLEQPRDRGRKPEFEIGCLRCRTYTLVDGKKVDAGPFRVRGGLLPRHAVEMWNEMQVKE